MPSPQPDPKPVTVPDFARWKKQRKRFSVLTAYDYPFARLLDEAGIDVLLVGDSLGTVLQGHETTLRVTLDQMIYHAEMVARAAQRALVVADLPFGSYQISPEQAVASSIRCLKETRAQAVKLEGGVRMRETIEAVVQAEIPVIGHVGLTPQSVHRIGGYKVQRDAQAIREDARAVAEAGAVAVVLECIPPNIAAEITAELPIPTIGIGAGPDCDAQVLVLHDLLGLFETFTPRFVRRYAELAQIVREAAARYHEDVAAGRFPTRQEAFAESSTDVV
jgi:3-methyl-2-oxobutanoate hydroxymethyltransferase